MSPTRRSLLIATGAVIGVAGLNPAYARAASYEPEVDDDGAVASDDAVEVAPEAEKTPDGLPETRRLVLISCEKCNRPIGEFLIDELDARNVLVCGRCIERFREHIQDLEEQLRDAQDEVCDHDDIEDLDEVRDERDELKEKLHRLEANLRLVLWDMRDLEARLDASHARQAWRVVTGLERSLERL